MPNVPGRGTLNGSPAGLPLSRRPSPTRNLAVGSIVPIVAASAARRRRLVDEFRTRGALSPERAILRSDLDLTDAGPFADLFNARVIREAAPGRVYLDLPTLQAYDLKQGRMVLFAGLLVAALLLGAWLVYTLVQAAR